MAGEPVTAWREPVLDRVRRWARRNRTAVTAAAAALVVALAGTGAVLAVSTQANIQLKAANGDLADANTRVKQSNDELHAANVREHERFELAIQAVNLFHGEVSEDLLLRQEQFDSLRGRLLRGAADFYGKLETILAGQPDPASRAALGRAYQELGRLTLAIGNQTQSLAIYQKAVAVRRELASQVPASSRALRELCESLISAGSAQAHRRCDWWHCALQGGRGNWPANR